jgi:hypothetical protein
MGMLFFNKRALIKKACLSSISIVCNNVKSISKVNKFLLQVVNGKHKNTYYFHILYKNVINYIEYINNIKIGVFRLTTKS